MTDEALLSHRASFPTLAKSTHLISHSLGAMPSKAREHTARYLDAWENDSIEAWHEWVPHVDRFANLVAKVLGVAEGTVAVSQNCSTAQAVLASCFDWKGPRNKVVYSALEFSTVHYVWAAQARRGARVVMVPSDDGIENPLERFLAAIDEETKLVAVSHVLFRSSAVQDLAAIVARAHAVGAYVLADCYQSAGIMPLELGKLGIDFACGGSVKWMCGGPGAAYLYVRPDLRPSLEPVDTGWFGHAEPFAFDMGPMRYADTAWRMIGGTPAIPTLYASLAGWELVSSLDMHAVRDKSLRQTALLRSLAESRGFEIRTPQDDARRGGTMCFDFEGSQAVSKALNERHFFNDWRPGCGIRASPHFYTTDDEVLRFVAEIDRIRRGQ